MTTALPLPPGMDALRAGFAAFRANPVERFRVELRRKCAVAIRERLAAVDTITLDEFTSEIWEPESKALLGDEDVTGRIYDLHNPPDPELLRRLVSGLGDGTLAYHGNGLWHAGSGVIGPKLRDSAERLEVVRKAARILGRTDLTPAAKVSELLDLPGIGNNTATGLVMAFHPTEYAIYNRIAQSWGEWANSLERFQSTMRALRAALGAEDFLELDWFMYVQHQPRAPKPVAQPNFWWVNQGSSYDEESQGGFISSPANDGLGHHESLTKARPGDLVFHYVKKEVRAIGKVLAPHEVTKHPRKTDRDYYIVRVEYLPIERGVPLSNVPARLRVAENGPFDRTGGVKQVYMEELSREFVRDFVERFGDHGLPAALTEAVGQTGPAPSSASYLLTWNPTKWTWPNLSEQAARTAGGVPVSERWSCGTTQRIRRGDRVFLLRQAAEPRGIVAAGWADSDVFRDAHWDPAQASAGKEGNYINVRFGEILDPEREPLLGRDDLLDAGALTLNHLDTQSSGITIDAPEATKVEELWRVHLGRARPAVSPRPDVRRLTPGLVQARLQLPEGLIARCCAALNAGKHLLLVGPPGTGKSTIAQQVAGAAAKLSNLPEPVVATASADWTTFDTIGGWTQTREQTLTFREGVVLRALREQRWLVLDEVNRADIDKCFGELFTVLAGGEVTTAYEDDAGQPVMIGPRANTYRVRPTFRLLATMNVRDKASLFRLSFAFLRRFAVVHVPVPSDGALRTLAAEIAASVDLSDDARDLAARLLSREHGFGQFVELGPSMLIDVLQYAAERGGDAQRAVGEGLAMFVFPQLEGLGDARAQDADALLTTFFGPTDLRDELRSQLRSSFPHLPFYD